MHNCIRKIKQFICGLTHHRFKAGKTMCEYDEQTGKYKITEHCMRCGKEFSFTFLI